MANVHFINDDFDYVTVLTRTAYGNSAGFTLLPGDETVADTRWYAWSPRPETVRPEEFERFKAAPPAGNVITFGDPPGRVL
jgi:hypothetical protein